MLVLPYRVRHRIVEYDPHCQHQPARTSRAHPCAYSHTDVTRLPTPAALAAHARDGLYLQRRLLSIHYVHSRLTA